MPCVILRRTNGGSTSRYASAGFRLLLLLPAATAGQGACHRSLHAAAGAPGSVPRRRLQLWLGLAVAVAIPASAAATPAPSLALATLAPAFARGAVGAFAALQRLGGLVLAHLGLGLGLGFGLRLDLARCRLLLARR